MLNKLVTSVFGSRNERLIRQMTKAVSRINAMEPEIEQLDDAGLRAKTDEFRRRYKEGETLNQLLPEAFAVAREAAKRHVGMRPFDVQLIGGMVFGVLFLDELTEFHRRVLEVLREPLETGRIVISRAAHQAEFPARFQLVAAMNPCPCGHLGDGSPRCHCTEDQVRKYRARVSGPLLDRIDLQVEVPRLKAPMSNDGCARHPRDFALQAGESSKTVRDRVAGARQRQLERQGMANSELNPSAMRGHCALDAPCHRLLDQAVEQLHLSTRARHRILRLARTIADLERVNNIGQAHLAEAIGYRTLDRRH